MGYIDNQILGYDSFTQGTPKQVSILTTSTPILAANPLCIAREFINNSSSTIFLQYNIPAGLNQGKRIKPGGFLTLTGNELYTGAINAIATANANLDVIEGA